MKSPKALLLIGLVAYAFFLLWQLPAEQALALLAPRGETGLQARTVEGSWHHGVGRDCSVWGLPLREIGWRFRPLALLSGRLSVTLRGKGDRSAIEATLSRGLTTLHIEALEGRMALAELTPLLSPLGLRLEGILAARLSGVEVREGRLSTAQGKVVWQEAALDPRTRLGTLVALISTTREGVKATVSDEGGPLRAEGVLRLAADGGYTMTLTLAARGPEAKELLDRLAPLGQRGDGGVLHLARQGQLPLLTWP